MAGSKGKAAKDVLDNPPRGLVARTFRVGDDRYVLFEFPVVEPEVPADVGARLSPAEREVLAGVLRGESNREIARSRGTSSHTVMNQLASIFRKLGARSRWELIARCRKSDLA